MFKIKTSDGIQLYGVDWNIKHPRAVICLVHGFGEHVNRYEEVAAFFNQNSVAFLGMDRRGFGISEGVKGHVPHYDVMLDEVDLMLEEAEKRYPNIPKILYGHSQGGNIALNHLIQRKPNIAASVVTSPWIALVNKVAAPLILLAKGMSRVYPKFLSPTNMDVKSISRDRTIVQSYIDDPLVHSYISAKNAVEMMKASQFLQEYEGELTVPTLLVHGSADEITSMKATKSFFERVKGELSLKIWDGLFHETHNEPEKEQVLSYTMNWLNHQILS